MLKVSSPARRPHAFNWSSPPWSSRSTQSLSRHTLGGGKGRRRCPGVLDQVISAQAGPRFAYPRQSMAPRRQIRWGLPGGQEVEHSAQRGPSRLREEVTSALRTPACLLRWGGGWLQATWALGGCGSGPSCPPWSSARGAGGAPGPSWGHCGRRRSVQQGPEAGRRLWGPTGQEAGEGCCPLAQLVRVAAEPWASGSSFVADPGPRRGGSQGGFSFMGWNSGCRELKQLPCAVTASQGAPLAGLER